MSKHIVTPLALLSYPHLFTPQPAMNAGEPDKFGAVFVFSAGTDLTELKEAAVAAAVEKWGDKAAGMLRAGKLNSPFRDDDDKGYPEGSIFIGARSIDQPGVVSKYADPETGKAREITDPSEVWAGNEVKGLLHAFAYDKKGNKGVTFSLDGVQKWADGTVRFDGRVKAADAFDAVAPAVADLSDLTGEDDDDDDDEDEVPVKKPRKARAKKVEEDDEGDLDLKKLL